MSDIHPTSLRLDEERNEQVILLTAFYQQQRRENVSRSAYFIELHDERWQRDGPRAEALAQQAQAPTGAEESE